MLMASNPNPNPGTMVVKSPCSLETPRLVRSDSTVLLTTHSISHHLLILDHHLQARHRPRVGIFGSTLTVDTCTLLSEPPKRPPPITMTFAGSSGMTIKARV